MKIIAIALNIALVGFILNAFNKYGVPSADEKPIAWLAIIAPLFNVFVLFGMPRGSLKNTLPFLYIQRKKLEEQARIDALKK